MHVRDARILVVDYHRPMREILKSLLFGLGVQHVFEAHDAAQAFDMLRYGVYDILLTDHDMAGESGVQLARRLRRSSGPNRRVPIVMITGHARGPVILAARDAGVDEYLVKPLATAALLQRIDAALNRRRPFVETPSYVGPDRRRRSAPLHGPDRRRASAAAAS
jgi:CheY-like chemotaxis protein